MVKAENVVAHPQNVIPLVNREWNFKTDENRPALVRVKDGSISLYIGEKDKKWLYDGQFIEAHVFKSEERNVTWEMVEAKLKTITIKIID